MAGKSTISITFKLDGDGKGFQNLANDAQGLKKTLASTLSQAQKFNTKAINFAAITTGINQASDSINQLMGTLGGLTDTYRDAKQAQVQLTTVMQQRMGASAADVQSINNQIKAQTQLGVIGAVVQKRGAQQIATFINQKSSLDTLIPAMNNLLAQQKGLNATQEDAFSVANMMGKAMQGQTTALRRVGVTFTAAQANVMKYGDESQRAAMLAQIITDNVGDMNAQLGKTDVGKQKQLENRLAGVKSQIGGVIQAAMPYLTAAANITMLAANATNAMGAIKLLGTAFVTFTVKSKLASAAMYIWRNATITVTAVTRILQSVFTGAAIGATTLKVALRGLLISTGIGVAIAGVTMLIEYFANKSDKASASAENAANGIDALSESSKRASDTYNSTQSETYSNLMTKYAQLQTAWKNLTSQQSKIAWIKNNQSAFADLGLRINSVHDAEYIFAKNTSAVVNSFVQRAKAAARLAQLTEEYRTQISLADKIQQSNDAANARHHVNSGDIVKSGFHSTRGGYESVGDDGEWRYTDKGAARANSVRWMGNTAADKLNRRAMAASQRRAKELEKGIAADARSGANRPFAAPAQRARVSRARTSRSDANNDNNKIIANAKSYTDLSHNLEVYKKRLDAVDPSNKKLVSGLQRQIALTETAAQKAKNQTSGINVKEPKTLEDLDAAIEKQQDLRKKATASNIAGYDKEIVRLTELKKQLESSGHTPIPVDQIKTYDELNSEISYYNDKLDTATKSERAGIQEHLTGLQNLKKSWDNYQEDLKKPARIEDLNTMSDLDDAVAYYEDLQKRQSADEITSTQKVIDVYKAKRLALQRSIDIPTMQKEVAEIQGLSDQDFKIKIDSIGTDELTERIKALKAQLDDLDNPPTSGQRKSIENLIRTYENWRAMSVKSFDAFRSGWDNIKGVGDGINNITSALNGNANAWQLITSLVDGALQIFESFEGIRKFIMELAGANTILTKSTEAQSAASVESAAATGTATAATGTAVVASTAEAAADATAAGMKGVKANASGTAAAASGTEAAASAAAATAAGTEAAADATAAGAKVMKAHAGIPFVGIAIGAGMLAVMLAAMTSIKGSMPKFANGGIITGPTLGLMGEYPGAKQNPEVVAPLNKLRGLLKSDNVSVGGEFKVRGRDLVSVIANETRVSSKRSNIKI